MKVFKHELTVTDEQIVSLPLNAQILSVAAQGEVLCLWALVDEEQPAEDRVIYVVGTGNPASHVLGATFVGSVLADPFVWHVFELRSR